MEPYNVKIITFPDLTKQVRIYSHLVDYHPKKVEKKFNPFTDQRFSEVHTETFEEHFDAVREVSLNRTKGKIYNYAKCNDWEFFVTFTFSKFMVDRYNYDECSSRLSKWLNNLRRTSPNLCYIVVPEQHKDGAWHFHGLVSGLDDREIVWSGKYVIQKVRKNGCRTKFVRTDRKIYKIGRYKLGWMTATEIQDRQRAITYITKYVTKDMMVGLFGKKRYWASRNLQVPEEEVMLLDQVDRMILSDELEEVCKYYKASQRDKCMAQSVEIFDFD